MVAEDVAHESMTLARALRQAGDLDACGAAAQLGWDNQTVVVVDEAGMVATPDIVRTLDIAQAADARVVFVGDPYQYSAPPWPTSCPMPQSSRKSSASPTRLSAKPRSVCVLASLPMLSVPLTSTPRPDACPQVQ